MALVKNLIIAAGLSLLLAAFFMWLPTVTTVSQLLLIASIMLAVGVLIDVKEKS
jgi:hypothetical protein